MAEQGMALSSLWQGYEAAYSETERVIRSHSKTFYFATTLLPVAERRAIRSLYAFCRASDDLVDCETIQPHEYAAWREEVALPAGEQRNPLLTSWARVREVYRVDPRHERDLLDGIQMDLEFSPFPTWKELEVYCYRVASTVGLLAMPIIGLAPGATFEQAAPRAIQLGVALQLTNILRDVGEDSARGRIYFPLEDLARFHLSLHDIQQQVYDSRFVDLMRFEITRARHLYEQALPGIALLAKKARPSVAAAALLYRRILDEIEDNQYQVYTHRAHTTLVKKIALLPEILRVAGK